MRQDYNYREYALRRSRRGFELARSYGAEDAAAAFAKGQQQLELVQRQATISRLYPHQVPCITTCADIRSRGNNAAR